DHAHPLRVANGGSAVSRCPADEVTDDGPPAFESSPAGVVIAAVDDTAAHFKAFLAQATATIVTESTTAAGRIIPLERCCSRREGACSRGGWCLVFAAADAQRR